jgi:hypothetical protein
MAGQTIAINFEFWVNSDKSMFAIDFNTEHPVSRVYLLHDKLQAITPSGDILDLGFVPSLALASILNGHAILVEFDDLGPVAEHVIYLQSHAEQDEHF